MLTIEQLELLKEQADLIEVMVRPNTCADPDLPSILFEFLSEDVIDREIEHRWITDLRQGSQDIGAEKAKGNYSSLQKIDHCPMCGEKKPPRITTWKEMMEEQNLREEYVIDDQEWFQVVCSAAVGGCGAAGGYAPTAEEAIAKWNMRAGAEPRQEDKA